MSEVIDKFILRSRCEEFLAQEAACLDEWRLDDWLGLLTADVDYRIPVRNSMPTDQSALQHSATSFHMVESFGSLKVRLQRLNGRAAWSETPRSRMRRHTSNVRIVSTDGSTLQVMSNLLLYWARDDIEVIVSARRDDVLRLGDDGLRLASRTVLLDHDCLPLPNLSLPL